MTGLELARAFFHEAVAPAIEHVQPRLRYTAGRFGAKSDALELDDAISRDHAWGPECQLLVDERADVARFETKLRAELPATFHDWPTAIEVTTLPNFLRANIGVSSTTTLGAIDWLAMDEQKLVELNAGALFRDDLRFADTRTELAFYPDDVRLHLMAVEWSRIADEQAFPARAGSRDDEVGSAIVQARLVESAMRLCFYLERRYPPYAKWFGTAFARLAAASVIGSAIERTLAARRWRDRDRAWSTVLHELLALHERAGLLAPGVHRTGPVYEGRPGVGLPQAALLVDALRARITDPEVLALPRRLGSVNQTAATRDLEEDLPRWREFYRALRPAS